MGSVVPYNYPLNKKTRSTTIYCLLLLKEKIVHEWLSIKKSELEPYDELQQNIRGGEFCTFKERKDRKAGAAAILEADGGDIQHIWGITKGLGHGAYKNGQQNKIKNLKFPLCLIYTIFNF